MVGGYLAFAEETICYVPFLVLKKIYTLLLEPRTQMSVPPDLMLAPINKPQVDFDRGVSPFSGDSDHFWSGFHPHLMGRVNIPGST